MLFFSSAAKMSDAKKHYSRTALTHEKLVTDKRFDASRYDIMYHRIILTPPVTADKKRSAALWNSRARIFRA
ncbi:MAG: hypothetical protein HZC28_19585 [Spirochaetes bacterium]|nr:hypothetical protein [Spirochaetota bacterium]